MVVGILLTVILLFAVLSKLSTQQQQNTEAVKATHRDLQESTQRIENDLACLQKFFGLPNRANLKITDLRTCTIEDTTAGTVTIYPASTLNPASTLTTPVQTTSTSGGSTAQPTNIPIVTPVLNFLKGLL